MNQIFGQRFIIFKKWGIGVNYCWNYGSSKLLLHFIEYRLDQVNSKHTKIAVNSAMQYFGPTTTKWRPCKIFVKLNGNHLLMANIFKLYEYQTFGLMKMRNVCKIWFVNKIFRPSKMVFFNFCFFPLPKFQMTIIKNLIMDFEGSK